MLCTSRNAATNPITVATTAAYSTCQLCTLGQERQHSSLPTRSAGERGRHQNRWQTHTSSLPKGFSSIQRPQNLLFTSRSPSRFHPEPSQCAARTVGWCTTFSARKRNFRSLSTSSYVSPSSGLKGLQVLPSAAEYLQTQRFKPSPVHMWMSMWMISVMVLLCHSSECGCSLYYPGLCFGDFPCHFLFRGKEG